MATNMTFVDFSTIVPADWLNNVNTFVNFSPVKSIAALRNVSKNTVTQVLVTGYYVAGDGGGGVYYLDPTDVTSPDNGGTIIVATDGGRWKLQVIQTVSVAQFGAKGDGTTDDTLSIQNTINSGIKDIYFATPSSFYKITTTLTVSGNGISLRGASQSQSAIIKQSTNNIGILVNTGSGNRFENLTLDYTTTPVSGATAFKSSGFGTRVSSFVINQAYIGMEFTNNSTQFIDNFQVYGYVSIGVWVHAVNDIYFNKFIINAGSASGALGGIRLSDKTEAIVFTDGDVLLGQFSLTTDAASYSLGNRPAYCNFTNVFFDSSISGSALNNIVETEFNGCWFSAGRSGAGSAGCTIQTSDSLAFLSTRFFNCGASGCFVSVNAKRTTFSECTWESNSVSAGAGVSPGLVFDVNCTDFSVSGGIAHNGLYTGTQGYGIQINSGCNHFVIRDVQVNGNATGPISDLSSTSADKLISGNIGYITANTGSGVLASGGTSVVISHGLGATPPASNISIVPTVSTGSNPLYVDTTSITSTQFVVRCSSAAASNFTFAWRATCSGVQ